MLTKTEHYRRIRQEFPTPALNAWRWAASAVQIDKAKQILKTRSDIRLIAKYDEFCNIDDFTCCSDKNCKYDKELRQNLESDTWSVYGTILETVSYVAEIAQEWHGSWIEVIKDKERWTELDSVWGCVGTEDDAIQSGLDYFCEQIIQFDTANPKN